MWYRSKKGSCYFTRNSSDDLWSSLISTDKPGFLTHMCMIHHLTCWVRGNMRYSIYVQYYQFECNYLNYFHIKWLVFTLRFIHKSAIRPNAVQPRIGATFLEIIMWNLTFIKSEFRKHENEENHYRLLCKHIMIPKFDDTFPVDGASC